MKEVIAIAVRIRSSYDRALELLNRVAKIFGLESKKAKVQDER